MQRFVGRVIMALCCCMFFAAIVQGKSLNKVYLKDGGVIECKSYRQVNGKVRVVVNRDVLVELSPAEVDMKRTFSRKPAKAVKKAVTPEKKVQASAGKPDSLSKPSAEVGNPPVTAGKPGGATASKTPAPVQLPKPAIQSPGQKAATPPSAQPLPAAPKSSLQPLGTATTAPAQKPGTPPSVQPVPAPVPAVKPGTPGQQPPAAQTAEKPAPVPGRTTLPLVTGKQPSPVSLAQGGIFGFGTLVPFLLLLVLLIASIWKVFTKAGESGWQCLIPLWNMYVLIKISGKPWWWFLLMFVPVVSIIIMILVHIALAARFNKGALFGLGLAFLGFIFYPILAFDKSTYE